MPTRTLRIETLTLADHRTIAVLDEGGALPLPSGGPWFEAGEGGVHLETITDEDEVPLAVEVWDGPAPRPPVAEWPVEATGTATFTTGRVGINFLVEGDDTVEFGVAPGTYAVRACTAGRPDLAPSAADDAPEAYLLQLWPR